MAGARAPAGRELTARRTATSRTWTTRDGRFHTRVYAAPVNYRDGHGRWRLIDDTLRPATTRGYAFENRSDAYRVSFPDRLAARPIEVTEGGDSLGFQLLHAHGHARASDASATFAQALPGVSVTYTSGPGRVKEDITLSSANAPVTYDYAIDLSNGLTLRDNPRGGIDVVTRQGDVRFSLEAPSAFDHAGARLASGPQLALTRIGPRRIRLSLDRTWLRSPDRAFPVTIDPGVDLADNQDCYISGGAGANTSYCGGSSLKVGWDGTQAYRALLRFDLSGIPANSAISGAHVLAYLNAKTTSNTTGVSAYQLTRSWSASATWNKYDGLNPWTSPGGDVAGTPLYTNPSASDTTGCWYAWGASNLVQQWQDGVAGNYGVLLREPVENVNNVMSYTSGTPTGSFAPYLQVDWEPKFMGSQRWYPMAAQTPIGDRQSLAVNADGGNLVVRSTDLQVAGVGMPFTVGRTYNNLSPDMDSWGYGWQINGGFDMWLDQYSDGQTFYDATGTPFHFTKNSDGSYTSPPGIDATLKTNADATNTITYNHSHLQINFDDDGDRLTSIVDRNGNALTYTYGANGMPSSVTDTQGRTTTFTYESGSWSPRISLITDSSGRSESYTYYPSGGPLKTFTDGAGKTTTYSYDDDSDLTQIVDGNGSITQIGYDAAYRVASIKRITDNVTLAGNTTTFTYNSGNTVVTDPRGHATTYYFDPSGRTTKQTDANGHSDSLQYNADNQTTSRTSPLNQTYTNAYDTTFRAQSSQQPDAVTGGSNGLKSLVGYDSTITSQSDPRFWLPKTSTDTQGNQSTYTYDSAGNVKTQTDSLGTVTYTYNPDGTTATAVDGNGHTTSYGYTAGNLTTITPPSPLQPETATYDSLGRVHTMTDGDGVTVTYTYDGDDRTLTAAYSSGPTLTYTYDGDGNTLSVTDPTGQSTYHYDLLNRLVQENLPGARTNVYAYDGADNLTSMQDAGGTTTYSYDAGDLLSSVQAPGEASPTTFSYYGDDMQKDVTYPNGVVLHRVYDNPDRLTTITATHAATTLASYTYAFKNGTTDTNLVHSVTDKNGVQTTYGYDARNQLTAATAAAGHNYTYAYDADGNLTRATTDAVPRSFGYNAAGMPCWSVASAQSSTACSPTPTGATTYSYDGAGNMTASSGGFSAHYNKLEQTTDMTGIAGGASLAFTYRGRGQTARDSAGGTSYTGNVFGLGVEKSASGSTCYTRSPDGTVLSERLSSGGGTCNGARYYYVFDGLDSVVALTDGAGTVQDTYTYDPYGKTTATGAVPNPVRFTGAYQDSTGMYKMGERYYSPDFMHWTQPDPACSSGGPAIGSPYSYGGDDPINQVDPTGESAASRHAYIRCLIGCMHTVHRICSSPGDPNTYICHLLGLAICIEYCAIHELGHERSHPRLPRRPSGRSFHFPSKQDLQKAQTSALGELNQWVMEP